MFWRLGGLLLVTLFLTLLGHGLFVLRPAARILVWFHEQTLLREAGLATHALERHVFPVLDRGRLEDGMKTVFEAAPNLSMVIFRGDGEVLGVLRRPTWIDFHRDELRGILKRLSSGGDRVLRYSKRRPAVVVRRLGDGAPPTYVLVTAQKHGRQLVHQHYPSLWLRGLFLIFFAAAAAALLGLRLFTGRLTALKRGLIQLAEGEHEVQVEPGRDDEVGELIRAFNSTATKLRGAMDELEAQAEARREMLADVSHELRTPLTSVRGHLELLLDDPINLNDDQRRSLEIVHEEALSLGQRIEDLLTIARDEAGQLDLVRRDVHLQPLLIDVTERYSALCEGREISLETQFCDHAVHVEADPQRLTQALRNLLENAMNNLSAGDHITVRLTDEPGEVGIEVIDTGPGIPPEVLETLFDRFQRGEGRRGAGTGLGLAITRRLAELHGGTCTATSTPGEGSCFRIALPPPLQERSVPPPAEEPVGA